MYDVPDMYEIYSTHPSRPFRYGYPYTPAEIPVNYFNQLNAYNIKPGDAVAEVGAASGWLLGLFSMYTDSVNYFAEDIDTNLLSASQLNNMVDHFSNQNKKTQSNSFHYCLGTTTQTNLPDGFFDLIFINNSFHEFENVDSMLQDIKTKLKPDGRLIISDLAANEYIRFKHQGCLVPAQSQEELQDIMRRNGLFLTKTYMPYGSILNHFIFQLNEQASEEYLSNIPRFQELLELSNKKVLKNQKKLDSLVVQLIERKSEIEEWYDEEAICDYIYYLGNEFYQNGKSKLTESIFYVGTKIFPYESYFYELISELEFSNKRKIKLLSEHIAKAIQYNDNESFYSAPKVKLDIIYAYCLSREDKFDKSIEVLADALESGATNSPIQLAEVFYNLYLTMLENDFNEEEMEPFLLEENSPIGALNRAIELNSLESEYFFARASLYNQAGQLDKAIDDLGVCIYLHPYEFSNYYLRARLKKKLGDKTGHHEDMQTYKFMKWRTRKGYL
jgi:SAM-dependent methyltransferase